MKTSWPDYVLLSLCVLISGAVAGADEQLAPILNAPPQANQSPQQTAIGGDLQFSVAVSGDQQLAPIVNAITQPDMTPKENGGDSEGGVAVSADPRLAPIVNAITQPDMTPQTNGNGLEGGVAVSADPRLAPIVNAITQPDMTPQTNGNGLEGGVAVSADQRLAPIVNAIAHTDTAPRSAGSDLHAAAAVGADQQFAPVANTTAQAYGIPRPLAGGSGLLGSTAGSGEVRRVSQLDSSVLSNSTVAENSGDEDSYDSWTDNDTERLSGVSCGDGQCVTECNGALDCSCVDCSQRSYFVFGEFTYLRPRNAAISYGVPIDGPIEDPPLNPPIQVGSVGVVDPDYQPGFRAGLGVELNSSWMVLGRFWQLRSNTSDQIQTEDPNVIRSMVSHPSSASAASDFLQASARYDIDFDLIDVDFQYVWGSDYDFAVNYFVGARYANLEQEFVATFVNSGVEQVATDIGFDGGGIRLGLEGVRFAGARGLHVYGRGAASFVGGQFRARYAQGQSFDPMVVDTSWESGRVVTMLDVEAGLGWQSSGGRVRVTAGYAFSAWLNAVTSDDLIKATQTNDFTGMDSTLSFDGLTTGVELRF